MSKIIETIEEIVVHENDFVTVYDNEVQFPSGLKGTYFRTRWKAPHGVAILPIVGSEVILLHNYRYSEQSLSIEVPQGFGTHGSSPIKDARREMEEELGVSNIELELVDTVGSDFITYLFFCYLDDGFTYSFSNIEDTEVIIGASKGTAASFLSNTQRQNVFDAITKVLLMRFLLEKKEAY